MLGCGRRVVDVVEAPVVEILLLGCVGSGKTLLTRQLQRLCKGVNSDVPISPATSPTSGVEVEKVSVPSVTLSLKEVGGSMAGTWPSHVKAASAVIFCVSTASPAHLSPSLIHLLSIVCPSNGSPPPVLLLFTHIDSPFALSASTLHSLCRFSDLAPPPTLQSLSCSPLTGEGCPVVLAHLTGMALTLHKRH